MTKAKEIETMLNRMTRVTPTVLERYARRLTNSRDTRLEDVYHDYSVEIDRAYKYCTRFCDALDGYNFRILSHNTFAFTVGFLFEVPDGKTALAVMTPNHNYYCVYSDLALFV